MNYYNKITNFIVREGRCQYVENEYHEKGVDSLVIIDLMETMLLDHQPKVNKIILLACDTDFVPAIEKLRKNGYEVILFHYTDKKRGSKFSMSNHLEVSCNRCILLERDHLLKSLYVSKK